MKISELRNHIKDQYLNNEIISGAEAKKLVGLLAKDGLTKTEKKNLEKIRKEFKDSFSTAGLREFDKALSRAVSNMPTPTGTIGSGNTVLDAALGLALPTAKDPIRLSNVADHDVRKALRRLDFNNDGKVDLKDRDKMGFGDDQWRSFLYFAALMGTRIVSDDDVIPSDFGGKKVAFTAVPDKKKAKEWAEAMGAKVVTKLNDELDFLIVGASAGTAKDERAHALNALGVTDIEVCDYSSFSDKAHAAGVTGPAPTNVSAAELRAKIGETVEDWYKDHMEEHYAWELADATTPDERANVEADKAEDMEGEAEWMILGSDDWGYWEDDRSDPDGSSYRDRFGVPISNSDLVEVSVDFFPAYAGIGLGTYMLFDGRTGEHLDTGDIHD